MKNDFDIINLKQDKQALEQRLSELVYGSVEIRKRGEKKYLYVHQRLNGRVISRYVGEYSQDLYNLILTNNTTAKELKQRLKDVSAKLATLGIKESPLRPAIEVNIDLAKRMLVDSIYDQAILEGVATTFVETERIISGGIVQGMTQSDMLKIVNLKHAWEFILSEEVITSESNFALLSQINRLVEEGFYYGAGKIRGVPVRISGTSWQPSIPIESQIKEELAKILTRKISNLDKAIDLLLYIMRRQIFIDGNKRTAVIFANHFLIARGLGIIAIPAELADEYKRLLLHHYETGKKEEIAKFLQEKCYLKITPIST